jgi:hypothetical protein
VLEEKFQRSIKIGNRCSLDVLKIFLGEAVVRDLLKNAKLNGDNTTSAVKDKATLARACGVTLPVEPLWVGSQFKLEPSNGRHYNSNETIRN